MCHIEYFKFVCIFHAAIYCCFFVLLAGEGLTGWSSSKTAWIEPGVEARNLGPSNPFRSLDPILSLLQKS
jgi:hypothetical protein